jgi:ArsR family transcriptional regulator
MPVMEKVFDALASTPRRRILAYLSKTSLTAGEIAERFDMSKPALSKHLKILENAGLVTSEKNGQYVTYRLVEASLVNTLHTFIATFCPEGGPLKKESAALAKSGKARPASEKSGAAKPIKKKK